MNIRVDNPVQLKEYGENVIQKAKEFLDETKKIEEIVTELSNTWQGAKSQMFKQKFDKCLPAFKSFAENLDNFGDLIKATGAAYIAMESEI